MSYSHTYEIDYLHPPPANRLSVRVRLQLQPHHIPYSSLNFPANYARSLFFIIGAYDAVSVELKTIQPRIVNHFYNHDLKFFSISQVSVEELEPVMESSY